MTNVQVPILKVVVKDISIEPSLCGLCAGFETGSWRFEQLAEHLIEWLPEFALNKTEFAAITGVTARKALREAAKSVYTSEKYQKRGELGEILLHAIIRQEFETVPLISKIFFKDSANDTVKGFDAVHVVMNQGTMQLWLGEVKFYKSGTKAISDVIAELDIHLENHYLRQEFTAICHKIERDDPLREHLTKLLHANKSLDEIFPELYIPVLLTYDSTTLAKHKDFSKEYCEEIEAEFRKYYKKFQSLKLKANVKVLLILLPMNTKDLLVNEFDKKLKGLSL